MPVKRATPEGLAAEFDGAVNAVCVIVAVTDVVSEDDVAFVFDTFGTKHRAVAVGLGVVGTFMMGCEAGVHLDADLLNDAGDVDDDEGSHGECGSDGEAAGGGAPGVL